MAGELEYAVDSACQIASQPRQGTVSNGGGYNPSTLNPTLAFNDFKSFIVTHFNSARGALFDKSKLKAIFYAPAFPGGMPQINPSDAITFIVASPTNPTTEIKFPERFSNAIKGSLILCGLTYQDTSSFIATHSTLMKARSGYSAIPRGNNSDPTQGRLTIAVDTTDLVSPGDPRFRFFYDATKNSAPTGQQSAFPSSFFSQYDPFSLLPSTPYVYGTKAAQNTSQPYYLLGNKFTPNASGTLSQNTYEVGSDNTQCSTLKGPYYSFLNHDGDTCRVSPPSLTWATSNKTGPPSNEEFNYAPSGTPSGYPFSPIEVLAAHCANPINTTRNAFLSSLTELLAMHDSFSSDIEALSVNPQIRGGSYTQMSVPNDSGPSINALTSDFTNLPSKIVSFSESITARNYFLPYVNFSAECSTGGNCPQFAQTSNQTVIDDINPFVSNDDLAGATPQQKCRIIKARHMSLVVNQLRLCYSFYRDNGILPIPTTIGPNSSFQDAFAPKSPSGVKPTLHDNSLPWEQQSNEGLSLSELFSILGTTQLTPVNRNDDEATTSGCFTNSIPTKISDSVTKIDDTHYLDTTYGVTRDYPPPLDVRGDIYGTVKYWSVNSEDKDVLFVPNSLGVEYGAFPTRWPKFTTQTPFSFLTQIPTITETPVEGSASKSSLLLVLSRRLDPGQAEKLHTLTSAMVSTNSHSKRQITVVYVPSSLVDASRRAVEDLRYAFSIPTEPTLNFITGNASNAYLSLDSQLFVYAPNNATRYPPSGSLGGCTRNDMYQSKVNCPNSSITTLPEWLRFRLFYLDRLGLILDPQNLYGGISGINSQDNPATWAQYIFFSRIVQVVKVL